MEELCALCEKRAMMLCDSDQAKLCWDCDEKVHSANFLVAKHSRVLLCRLCHSPTPWKASGTKLTPTVSFCLRCVDDRHARLHHLVNDEDGQQERDYVDHHREHESDDVFDSSDNDSDDSNDEGEEDEGEEDEDEDDDEDEEGENQVVPMSSCSSVTLTSSFNCANSALKRSRNDLFSTNSSFHDEAACSSSEIVSASLPSGDESTSTNVLKRHRYDQQN